ncbi:hypothetical protein Belba_2365 [Belliella baltica DSM 15883]|uniref:Uncharacterized protein n=1 Tax=Belliella baltica (strain DSM 15883 / CIP 108006 / LMG 21964 / BA134) TaxID=866536 RepID=I3Z6Q7_BELBD|nr:hypothetical protein Belba_2365 [Belliella baltica DSM 15883]
MNYFFVYFVELGELCGAFLFFGTLRAQSSTKTSKIFFVCFEELGEFCVAFIFWNTKISKKLKEHNELLFCVLCGTW